MLIKICGVTHPDDAILAAQLGAQYIGIVLAAGHRRTVTLEQAKRIAEACKTHGAIPIAIFVEESANEIVNICASLGITTVELHGAGSRSAYETLKDKMEVFYALQEAFPNDVHFVLYDSKGGSGQTFDWNTFCPPQNNAWFLAGGLTPQNVAEGIRLLQPSGVSVSTGVETHGSTRKDPDKLKRFIQAATRLPYGGQYLPEILMAPLLELEAQWNVLRKDKQFCHELAMQLHHYAGRPTPLTEIERFAKAIGGPRMFLKREDLLHTGAHKINNALGQCLLAKRLGKTRIIAETGAGQHGVATATACARLDLECVVYMGATDMARQKPNVERMRLLGATVKSVTHGDATLKDAINEALRDWSANYEASHYCLGSALGPHPYPEMVREFQSVISLELRNQLQEYTDRDPDMLIACVGGGSNAIGFFHHYIDQTNVKLVGVEAGGLGLASGKHAARFAGGHPGVLHGCHTYLLQDAAGQVQSTHSISAGLDYPAVGPDHANLFDSNRASYVSVTDEDALAAFHALTRLEGIIPALESSHALAYAMKIAHSLPSDSIIVINLSGRGDKDLSQVLENAS